MNDITVKQLYKLLSSYHRQSSGTVLRTEAGEAEVSRRAAYEALYMRDEQFYKGGRKILAGFMACGALMLASAGYTFWHGRKVEQLMREEINGNPVVSVGGDMYGIIENKRSANCHEFVVGRVDITTGNNRPFFINAEKAVRFSIPDGCKP